MCLGLTESILAFVKLSQPSPNMAALMQRDTPREKRCEFSEQANYPVYFSWLIKQTIHYVLLSSFV